MGGFLASAAATAAGVAGGALLFEGVKNFMGDHSGAAGIAQAAAPTIPDAGAGQTSLDEGSFFSNPATNTDEDESAFFSDTDQGGSGWDDSGGGGNAGGSDSDWV
jgi:hypothetical protein